MSHSSTHEIETIYYFVDEAGDPNLFAKRGNIIIGSEGCTNFFILGKLDIEDPKSLNTDLENLRSELLSDSYFKNVPSMQPKNKKTTLAFHAKDDLPEVRREVYKVLIKYNSRFYAVVRDKRELLEFIKRKKKRNSTYRYNPNELYDSLTKTLFKAIRPMADKISICFAKRGNKERTKAFQNALEKAEDSFEKNFGFRRNTNLSLRCSTPPKDSGLQAVDYYLWALQRFYERAEDRYIEMLWPHVGEIHDLDFIEKKRKGVFFRKRKPLNLKTRPL